MADIDNGGHRPGALDQGRQPQWSDHKACIVKPRQPPGFHDRADLRDALAEAELLNRRHQLKIEIAVSAVARNKVARPFPDQRIRRASLHRGKVREYLTHH
jgi:hypothetical protein